MKKLTILLLMFCIFIKGVSQYNSLSLSFAPQVSSYSFPKEYQSYTPAMAHSFNLNYHHKNKKNNLIVSLQQHSYNARTEYEVTSPNSPESGIGRINTIYATKGITLNLGYGFTLVSNEKFELIPFVTYGIGRFYKSGLRNENLQTDTINGISIIYSNQELENIYISEFHQRFEISSKMVFKPQNKVHFYMQPSFSTALRFRDPSKEYAFRFFYWSFGLNLGVEFTF